MNSSIIEGVTAPSRVHVSSVFCRCIGKLSDYVLPIRFMISPGREEWNRLSKVFCYTIEKVISDILVVSSIFRQVSWSQSNIHTAISHVLHHTFCWFVNVYIICTSVMTLAIGPNTKAKGLRRQRCCSKCSYVWMHTLMAHSVIVCRPRLQIYEFNLVYVWIMLGIIWSSLLWFL